MAIKNEEIWEPCSDWGRSMKPYLDQVKRQAVVVKSKNRKPRMIITVCAEPGKPGRPRLTPEQEEARRQKKNAKERDRHNRTFVPVKPTSFCGKCGLGLSAQNKIGFCNTCATKAVRNELKLGPRPRCHCGVMLNRHNKSGLCEKHSAAGRQMAYQARKVAA